MTGSVNDLTFVKGWDLFETRGEEWMSLQEKYTSLHM